MLFAVVVALAVAQPPRPPVDATAVIARAIAAERRFVKQWRDAWMDGVLNAQGPFGEVRVVATPSGGRTGGRPRSYVSPIAEARLAAVHCHPGDDPGSRPPLHRIASATSRHGWCPAWYPLPHTPVVDEAAAIDSALPPERRARIAAARRALLATLDSASRLLPTDRFLVEQRVRFLVDAGALDSALAVVRTCGARAATCATLGGYVLARRGDAWAADSAFAVARAAMTDAERCAWDDVSDLLDDDGRAAYARLTCAARDSANARLWWLARPLLAEPVNERRVEHDARRTYVALHAALGADERHDWLPAHAGDALARMYVRYGVPSHLYWSGPQTDDDHDRYLTSRLSPPSPPYTAAEYGVGRVHVVPAWRAVGDPVAARNDDWELAAPHPDALGTWWPAEHWARPAGPLATIPEGQTALLRRAQGALLAVSTTVGPRASSGEADAVLVVSWHPDTLMQVAHDAPRADGRLVLSGSAGTRPALVGVELPGRGSAARARFGVVPPPPLVAMTAGETAVSPPVLLDVPAGAPAPNDPDSAIARMLPTTGVRGARRVGVYWESYGLTPSDTVDVALRVARADDDGDALAVRWREPRPDRVIRLVEAPRPVIARSVVLDLSRLPGGRYWLEVSVGRPGAEPARARRAIVLD